MVIIAKLNKIFEAMPNKIFGKYSFIINIVIEEIILKTIPTKDIKKNFIAIKSTKTESDIRAWAKCFQKFNFELPSILKPFSQSILLNGIFDLNIDAE